MSPWETASHRCQSRGLGDVLHVPIDLRSAIHHGKSYKVLLNHVGPEPRPSRSKHPEVEGPTLVFKAQLVGRQVRSIFMWGSNKI